MSPISGGMLQLRMVKALQLAGLADAVPEARDLILSVLKIDRQDFATRLHLPVGPSDMERCASLLDRRLAGEPIDRILGWREFRGRIFKLNADCLAPREDSETVVGLALRRLPKDKSALRIADLGTGSGILIISLLLDLPAARGVGIDASGGALAMAQDNAARLGVGDRVAFVRGDWFAGSSGSFDLVVTNPPYIRHDALAGLEREVRDHDPVLALDGGADGLEAYRRIAAGLGAALNPGGCAVFEIGQGQGADVRGILASHGFPCVETMADFAGIERALAFRAAG
jgi:release factor glutamine methyltransferase